MHNPEWARALPGALAKGSKNGSARARSHSGPSREWPGPTQRQSPLRNATSCDPSWSVEPPPFETASPAEYLPTPPRADEQILIDMCDLHTGAATPFHMTAKLALRLHRVTLWAHQIESFFRRARKLVIAAASTAALNLAALGVYTLHRYEQNGAASERLINQERTIQELRLDIRELRAEVRRMSGIDPATHPSSPPGGGIFIAPDKISRLFRNIKESHEEDDIVPALVAP